jgi:hypothetical protein
MSLILHKGKMLQINSSFLINVQFFQLHFMYGICLTVWVNPEFLLMSNNCDLFLITLLIVTSDTSSAKDKEGGGVDSGLVSTSSEDACATFVPSCASLCSVFAFSSTS